MGLNRQERTEETQVHPYELTDKYQRKSGDHKIVQNVSDFSCSVIFS